MKFRQAVRHARGFCALCDNRRDHDAEYCEVHLRLLEIDELLEELLELTEKIAHECPHGVTGGRESPIYPGGYCLDCARFVDLTERHVGLIKRLGA